MATTTDWRQLCIDLIAASRQPWVFHEEHLIEAIWQQLEAIELAVDADAATTTPTTPD